MHIIFSPEYSGTVYVKPADGKNVMMDTVVVNTIGLLDILELRLGLHYEGMSDQDRLAYYYAATSKYMSHHPDNVLAESFKIAGLSTAKSILAWRDELRSAGWKFEGSEISGRLAVIIGVEEYFRENNCHDLADRLETVVEYLENHQFDCTGMTLSMPVNKSLLKPCIKRLVEAMEACGSVLECGDSVPDNSGDSRDVCRDSDDDSTGDCNKVNNLSKVRELVTGKKKGKIKLDPNDDSIQIWKFGDEYSACEYLSYSRLDDVDVWVNADNRLMDSYMALMDKPLTGSVEADSTPQLTRLPVMGLGMFSSPLNINTLIEWLNMPVHPLDKFFRSVLAETIVSNGGYLNEACADKINQYIEGKFVFLTEEQKALPEAEQEKIRLRDKSKRQKLVDVFLPQQLGTQLIEKERVHEFVSELSSWTSERAVVMAKDPDNSQWSDQLTAVAGMCDTFSILLETVQGDTVDFKTIDSWMSEVCQSGSFTNTIAEKGCRTVVDSPAKIASVAENCVWIGVDGDPKHEYECAFLYRSEKEKLQEMMTPWAEESQNSYYESLMMTPLLMTRGKLILVTRDRVGGETTLKHPLIVRLEQQIENIGDFVHTHSVGAEGRRKVELVDHTSVASGNSAVVSVDGSVASGNVPTDRELHFDHADKIKWPDHLSPTVIDTLVEYPFDYLMDQLLGITNDAKAQMADLKTVKGNVAHAVIQELFSPENGNSYANATAIEGRIAKEFEKTYKEVLEAKGALLLLSENRLEEKLFHGQLRHCVDVLLEILKDNNLKVTGCERCVESNMNLGLPKATDKDGNILERDMIGYIDMTLEDKNGHPVVFDFKWTSSPKRYQDTLKDNRSTQLELYRLMLSREKKDEVQRVAYFLMPEARLYSQEQFDGRHFVLVKPENRDNIVVQLRQSAIYRKNQIESGLVEVNGVYEDLQYVKDTDSKGLFPLKKTDDGTQESNAFSMYNLFNSK